jgi:uncharacterized protein YndB with AHSA1/START domain
MMSNATGNRHGSAVVTLQGDTDILVTRKFDAPAALVYRAWTTPEYVKRWWGFSTSEWQVCEVDLRVGGAWRFVIREKGYEVGFHGEYREIDAPTRLVSTEVYEGFPAPEGTSPDDHAAVNTMTLEEVDGVTTMTILTRHTRREHRDAHIESGMESGMQVSFDRMEDLVRELA